MTNNSNEVDDLVKLISKFPGLGPKSAKRIVLKLINNRESLVKPLVKTLSEIYKNISRCQICGNIKSNNSSCSCTKKNYSQICVVENISDMWVIEETGVYKGQYHVLGGTLSSFDRNKEDALLLSSLIKRVNSNSVEEIILATSATIEGQQTAHYIQDRLKGTKIKITKLAQGLPVGGEIEFLDDGTLFSAFKNRGPVAKD